MRVEQKAAWTPVRTTSLNAQDSAGVVSGFFSCGHPFAPLVEASPPEANQGREQHQRYQSNVIFIRVESAFG